MITHQKRWKQVDLLLRVRTVKSYRQALRVFESLYWEARHLRVWPKPSMADLGPTLRLSRALQCLPTS